MHIQQADAFDIRGLHRKQESTIILVFTVLYHGFYSIIHVHLNLLFHKSTHIQSSTKSWWTVKLIKYFPYIYR